MERHGLEAMAHAVDEDGSLWAAYGVHYQPAWVLINQDGEVRVHPGSLADIEAAVADLLAR